MVVVGGGIIGITSALALLEAGFEVTVVNRASPSDGVATDVNAGLISPGHALAWANPSMLRRIPRVLMNRTPQLRVRSYLDPELLRWGASFIKSCTSAKAAHVSRTRGRIGRRSAEIFRRIDQELNLGSPFREGMVFVHGTRESLERQLQAFQVLIEDGHDLRPLDSQGVLEVEPSLGESDLSIAGAIHHPEGLTADSRAIADGILAYLMSRGATIVTDDVTELVTRRDRVESAVTASGNAIAGDAYVIAAGVHSVRFLDDAREKIHMYPVRGYGLTWSDLPDDAGPRIGGLNETDLIAWSRTGDSLRITGIAEFDRGNPKIHPADLDLVYRSAIKTFPFLEKLPDPHVGSGFRPMTADGLPRIGKLKPNLFVNTGHGNLGWTMAFGSAELLAAAVAGNPLNTPVAQAVAPRIGVRP